MGTIGLAVLILGWLGMTAVGVYFSSIFMSRPYFTPIKMTKEQEGRYKKQLFWSSAASVMVFLAGAVACALATFRSRP